MRTWFRQAGAGSGLHAPVAPPRAPRWPLAVFVLVAFGCSTAIAAAYEAFEDMEVRGVMDGEGAANSYALAILVLLAAIVLGAGFGFWKLIEPDARDLSGD
jgi:hypothetical protein